jgi:hypothetical protein
VTVLELAELFEGSEQLVSISSIPWYTRQSFPPELGCDGWASAVAVAPVASTVSGLPSSGE